VVLLVAAPVALTVFFVPYGLYAGWVGEMGRWDDGDQICNFLEIFL
jgi:hypothetical protein